MWRGLTCFRAFLIADTLQVDLAFWPATDFGATTPTFRLLFGQAKERPSASLPNAAELIDLGWLYALYVGSSLERRWVWQAEYMLKYVREQVLALAYLRQGLIAYKGRGIDDLPLDVTESLTGILPHALNVSELKRAFRIASDTLLGKIAPFDSDLVKRLKKYLFAATLLPIWS